MIDLEYNKDAKVSLFNKTAEMDLTWDWPCGVAYYGMAEATAATGREDYYSALKNCVSVRLCRTHVI